MTGSQKKLMALRFAELYAKYGNGTRAAREAGYADTSANSLAVQGSRLLKRADVQAYIQAKRVDRDVHAQKTYDDICELAEIAMDHVRELRQKNAKNVDFSRAVAVASKHLEVVARCDGLLVDVLPVDPAALATSLQGLVRHIPEYVHPSRVIDRPVIEAQAAAPSNGNGNGNGHVDPPQSFQSIQE